MGKYDPMTRFLRRQRTDFVELSFTEIERRLGALLPKAAASASWWDGEGVQGAAWRAAGFTASLLDKDERVRFARAGSPIELTP